MLLIAHGYWKDCHTKQAKANEKPRFYWAVILRLVAFAENEQGI